MRFIEARSDLPTLAYIATFYVGREEGNSSKSASEILKEISNGYSSAVEVNNGVELTIDSIKGYTTGFEEEDFQTFLLTLTSNSAHAEEKEAYDSYVRRLGEYLSKNPVSAFTVRVRRATSVREAEAALQEYLRQNRLIRSLGVVNSCLLATLVDRDGSSPSQIMKREIVTFPCHSNLDEANRLFWAFLSDMTSLVCHAGKLNQLNLTHEPVINQVDASEKTTQFRINEIFADIRRPVEQVKPENLEEMLREVTTLFSSLSILGSAIKRDYIRGRGILYDIRTLFDSWNEKGIDPHPTNSSMEMNCYSNLIAPFKNFVDRIDALNIQLRTVLDALRTNISIRQQKQNSQTLELQLRMLNSIEKHEKLLKNLTWVVAILTIMLVLLEIARVLRVLP
jgi:hypothetical protein